MFVAFFAVIIALAIDRFIGEPARWHPLVGFGHFANFIEARLNIPNTSRRSRGVFAILIVTVPWVLIAWFIEQWFPDNIFVTALIVYLAIGWQSLREHALEVHSHLQCSELPAAKHSVAKIVSRDVHCMDEAAINKAVIESTLENGNDALFGALFWFFVLGLPGVVLYRCINTLDAMWGYKIARFNQFGWAAAKLDDGLNYLPARLTAISYLIMGNLQNGWHCWQNQAKGCESPNGGVVMTAGAGSLDIQLGGETSYHGQKRLKPVMGSGQVPTYRDIPRALQLIEKSLLLWLVMVVFVSVLAYQFY